MLKFRLFPETRDEFVLGLLQICLIVSVFVSGIISTFLIISAPIFLSALVLGSMMSGYGSSENDRILFVYILLLLFFPLTAVQHLHGYLWSANQRQRGNINKETTKKTILSLLLLPPLPFFVKIIEKIYDPRNTKPSKIQTLVSVKIQAVTFVATIICSIIWVFVFFLVISPSKKTNKMVPTSETLPQEIQTKPKEIEIATISAAVYPKPIVPREWKTYQTLFFGHKLTFHYPNYPDTTTVKDENDSGRIISVVEQKPTEFGIRENKIMTLTGAYIYLSPDESCDEYKPCTPKQLERWVPLQFSTYGYPAEKLTIGNKIFWRIGNDKDEWHRYYTYVNGLTLEIGFPSDLDKKTIHQLLYSINAN